ncbi:MAG: pitrilysin family protein [Candidatus Moranbacteria bacterium]|nr:pitrilysin family protein [Candidatus Moranbacteria bacterium]
MKYQKHTLKNGLRILLAPMQETGTATVIVMTGVGSCYETRAENGLAHFLEHMFFKGTKKRPTAMDISKELDAIGAEYNAYTGKDRTAYYAKVEAHHWETALDVVSDLFLNATLDQEEIDRERGPVMQELNMYEDMPMRHIGDLWELHLYGDHPLGWEIIGPKSNLKRFMRKDFIKYLNRGYVAENVVIGVAGKIDPKVVKKEIEKHFAGIRTGKKPVFKKALDKQSTPGLSLTHKKTDQTQLIVGVRAYSMYHQDRYALSVLSVILGGGMSSRLFMAVRERRGLAYSVHTMVESFHDAGYLATQAGVEHENLEKTVQVILDEYKKISVEQVEKEELTKAKEYIKGKMAMGLEGSDDVVEYLVTQEVIRGEIVLPKEKAKLIDTVTAEDVLRVAQDIFQNKKLNLAVIGPKANKAKLEKLLKLS